MKPRLKGQAQLFRFADDATMVFASERDALRVMAVLAKRFAKFGLTLHPDKTRLMSFLPPNRGRSDSFSLLGFTHYWSKSRKGNWVVKRKTEKRRFSAALKRVSEWCRRERHYPVADQYRQLSRKLKGHYSYYGITGNSKAISRFRYEVELSWRKWLSRRSRKAGRNWEWFNPFFRKYQLPKPIAIHSVLRQAAKI